MLIQIDNVRVGDYVSVPLYLVENTRLPYPLFKVERITIEEADDYTKYVLHDRAGKPLLMRSAGSLVQFRGTVRPGVTYYKTGDRLPAGDLLLLHRDGVFDERNMYQVHDVLQNFQFIEFVQGGIRYNLEYGMGHRIVTFWFRHHSAKGSVHIRIGDHDGVNLTMVAYDTVNGERNGMYFEKVSDLKDALFE